MQTKSSFKHFTSIAELQSGRRLRLPVVAYRKVRPGVSNFATGAGSYAVFHFYERNMVAGRWCPQHTMVIFEPGQPRHFGREDRRWTHTWMHCGGYAVRDVMRESGYPLNEPVHIGTSAHAERCVLDLHAELTAYDAPDPLILQAVLTRFVCEVARLARAGDVGPTVPRPLAEARRHIELHYAERVTLPELARRASMSPQHFGMLFKKHFGTPPIDLVIRLRMEEASHLLRDVNMRVGEVAGAVGYDDIYHFSKLFKRHVGVCPREYRRTRHA